MGIFRKDVTIEALNGFAKKTLPEQLGIVFTQIGDNFIEARMPVDHRTIQPFGLLHGGASMALAETLGSIAGWGCIDPEKYFCVGLEINGNHLKSIREGFVTGTTTPIHIGKKTQVWEIKITNETTGDLICISRITLAVLERR